MFQNERYCTCGVNEEVPIVLQAMMWNMVDTMKVESKDYLQVFELTVYKFIGFKIEQRDA